MSSSSRILLIGAGAVGTTIGNWLAPYCENLIILDQGETLDIISQKGLTSYQQNKPQQAKNHPVKTISKLSEIQTPDYIVICVKYSLSNIYQLVFDHYGDDSIIVAFQNGIENQSILPKHFSKVIYGIVCYNAWLDSPGFAGFQKKGPLVIGCLNNNLKQEMQQFQQILNQAVETIITPHIKDAAISKMIINLTNSFTTLVGFTFNPISAPSLFQKILIGLTYEGIQIAKASGFKECKLGGMPSWNLISFSHFAPQWLTRKTFNKNVNKMVISSMAQDVIQNHSADNELETINGTLLKLANKNNVKAPFNRAIYQICTQTFSEEQFTPLEVEEVWLKILMLQG